MIRAVLAATFFAFRLIPRRLAVVGGRAVGWLMEHVFHFRTDVVDLQLQRVYGDTGKRSQTEIAAIRHGVYRHFGLLLFETLHLPGADLEPYRQLVTIEGREHLDAALATGKGVMLINAHVGNWELGAVSVVQAGYDFCAVSKEMRPPVVQTAMDMLRQTTGLDTFYRRNSARKILRALRQNRAVIMVIDQNMIDTDGADNPARRADPSIPVPEAQLDQLPYGKKYSSRGAFICAEQADCVGCSAGKLLQFCERSTAGGAPKRRRTRLYRCDCGDRCPCRTLHQGEGALSHGFGHRSDNVS